MVNARKASSAVTRAYQKQRTASISQFREDISLKSPEIHLRHDTTMQEPSLDVDSSLAMQRQMHSTWDNLDVLRK